MFQTGPIQTEYRTEVIHDWIDVNNHMNVRRYAEVFDDAMTMFTRTLGFNRDYIQHSGFTTFTAEDHLCYIAEARLGETLRITTRLLDADKKRLHLYQEMHVEGAKERLAATCEQMQLSILLSGPKVIEMEPDAWARVSAACEDHKKAFRPPTHAGRRIGIVRK